MDGGAGTVTAPQPFDLDAARAAAKAEGKQKPFPFTFGGESYEIPDSSQWPLDISEHLAEGRLDLAMKGLLGERYRSFAPHATIGDLELIFNALGKQMGVDLPNSLGQQPPVTTPT